MNYSWRIRVNREQSHSAIWRSQTGAKAVTVREATRVDQMVIVTISEKNIRDLPKGLFEGVPKGVAVVDTSNYYPRPRDGRIPEIEAGMPESRWIEQQLGRPVIKTFNNIYAKQLLNARPAGDPGALPCRSSAMTKPQRPSAADCE